MGKLYHPVTTIPYGTQKTYSASTVVYLSVCDSFPSLARTGASQMEALSQLCSAASPALLQVPGVPHPPQHSLLPQSFTVLLYHLTCVDIKSNHNGTTQGSGSEVTTHSNFNMRSPDESSQSYECFFPNHCCNKFLTALTRKKLMPSLSLFATISTEDFIRKKEVKIKILGIGKDLIDPYLAIGNLHLCTADGPNTSELEQIALVMGMGPKRWAYKKTQHQFYAIRKHMEHWMQGCSMAWMLLHKEQRKADNLLSVTPDAAWGFSIKRGRRPMRNDLK